MRREGSLGEVAPWRGPVEEECDAEDAATQEQYRLEEEGEGELSLSLHLFHSLGFGPVSFERSFGR